MDPVLFPKRALGRAKDSPPPEAPKAGALAFPLALSDLDRRELGKVGALADWPHPAWGRLSRRSHLSNRSNQLGIIALTTLASTKDCASGLGNLRARLGGMGSEKGLGAGCWFGPRGGKAQAL